MPSLECRSIYNAIDFAGPEVLKLEVNNIKPPWLSCLCQAHRMGSVSCLQSSIKKVATLHRPQLDAKLTVLTQEQAHETKVGSSFQGLHPVSGL